MTPIKYCLLMSAVTATHALSGFAQDDSLGEYSKVVEESKYPHDFNLINLPTKLLEPKDGFYYVAHKQEDNTTKNVKLSLDVELQQDLEKWVSQHGNHISALVVADVKTGKILALVQGQAPESWGADTHSALHTSFPAASLFKTVSTTASLDTLDRDSQKVTGLRGGCGKVNPNGVWLNEQKPSRNFRMSLKRAYALSCNGYFAQLGVKELGLGPILYFAEKFGWEKKIPSDFDIPISPIQFPKPNSSSVATVGKFTAGFGLVGLSAVHSTWQMLAIANDGHPIPIRITEGEKTFLPPLAPIMSKETAEELREVMRPTVQNGTASYAFRKRRYRQYSHQVGGKTGTLTGSTPKGLTTWFAGMMPIEKPEIVVSAVVVVGNKWIYKGPQLAAEAFRAWDKLKTKREKIAKRQGSLPVVIQ